MTETPEQGEQGERGLRGRQGMTGKAGSDPTKRLAILFAFLAIVSVAYGTVLQQAVERIGTNSERIEDNAIRGEQERRVLLVSACQNDLVIREQYNNLLDALSEVDEQITQELPNAPVVALQARIAAYQAGKIDPLPVCEAIKP